MIKCDSSPWQAPNGAFSLSHALKYGKWSAFAWKNEHLEIEEYAVRSWETAGGGDNEGVAGVDAPILHACGIVAGRAGAAKKPRQEGAGVSAGGAGG